MSDAPPGPASSPPEPAGEPNPFRSSIAALFLGIVLAIVVSRAVLLVGWGGELASQAAGAASGTSPLLLDGVRQRRAQRKRVRAASVRSWPRPTRLLVAALFGFALTVVDTWCSLLLSWLTRGVTARVDGATDQASYLSAFTLMVTVINVPLVAVAAVGLAARATHYLLPRPRRWILLGLALYAVLKVGLLMTASTNNTPFSLSVLVAGAVLLVPLIFPVALIGVWWGRRTHVVFSATRFFRRLPPEDQQAALTLLEESVQTRPRAPGPPVPSRDLRLPERRRR